MPAQAVLTAYEPPIQPGKPHGSELGAITFQFNPNQLELTRSAGWVSHQSRSAEEVAAPEFTGVLPRRLAVELFLDSSAAHDPSVASGTERLLSWCAPTARSIEAKAPCAPWVKFSWGSFTDVAFFGYLEDVSVTYTLFDANGSPLRATCGVRLTEAGNPTPRQNPTSGSLTGRRVHRLAAGDSLELLAHQEYGDPTVWRLIAEANGIEDPLLLSVGTEILVPARDEAAVR
ncbi:CIS tube protein [Streptomyces sp. NPDC054770]